MKLKSLLAMMVVLLTTTIFLNAQEEEFDCRAAIKALHEDFYNTNILPQHEIWRAEIQNALSQEDKDRLVYLKEQTNLIKAEIKTKIEAVKNTDLDRREKAKEIRNIQMEYKDKVAEIYKEIRQIWSRYDEVIKKINAEKKAKRAEWAEQMKAIMDNFCIEHPECCEKIRNHDGKEGKGGNGEKGTGHKLMGGKDGCNDGFECKQGLGLGKAFGIDKEDMEMLHIWLGDSNMENSGDMILGINSTPENLNLTAVPNPTNGLTIISFNLIESTNTRVYITDINGTIVNELFNGYANAGMNSYNFNTNQLAKGVDRKSVV